MSWNWIKLIYTLFTSFIQNGSNIFIKSLAKGIPENKIYSAGKHTMQVRDIPPRNHLWERTKKIISNQWAYLEQADCSWSKQVNTFKQAKGRMDRK